MEDYRTDERGFKVARFQCFKAFNTADRSLQLCTLKLGNTKNGEPAVKQVPQVA